MTEKLERLDSLAEMLLKARKAIEEKEKAFEESIKPLKELKAQIEGRVLAFLQKTGQTSAKTPHGTLITSTRDYASLADSDAFMAYVMSKGAFELMDRRANVSAVRDHVEEHGALPPGVNFSSRLTVSIRSK